jgi:hypothetical protein
MELHSDHQDTEREHWYAPNLQSLIIDRAGRDLSICQRETDGCLHFTFEPMDLVCERQWLMTEYAEEYRKLVSIYDKVTIEWGVITTVS